MSRHPNKIAVVSALGLNQILAWGSSFYLIAILAAPIVAETGWSLPSVIAGPSLGLLCAGLASRRVGRRIHRSGGRQVLGLAAILFVAGLVALAHVSRSVEFYLAWGIIGLGMGCGLYDAAFATLGRIYGVRARGAITALTLFGGFASTICWPISAWLAARYGWRATCLVYAAVHAFVSLPLLLWIIPRGGEAVTAPGGARAAPGIETTLERRRFVLLAATLTLATGVMSAVAVHVIGLLVSVGVDAAGAVALGTTIGPAQVAARLVEAGLQGRRHPVWTLISSVTLAGAGVALLAAHAPLPALALVAYGAGNGLSSIARGTMPLALFGPERYAIWMGRLGMPTLIAGAVAPYAASYVIEAWGPTACLTALAAAMGLAVAGALALAADIRADDGR